MRVHKFGGTSLADADRMRAAAALVDAGDSPSVVVASAMAGVTDSLQELARLAAAGDSEAWRERLDAIRMRHLEVARELVGEASRLAAVEESLAGQVRELARCLDDVAIGGSRAETSRAVDAVTAKGEDLSVILLGAALAEVGMEAVLVDARGVIRTEAGDGPATPRDEDSYRLARDRLLPLLAEGRTPVLQGFVAADGEGRTTTLGRGGSDFTAAIIGAALDADEVTIWTDVDGIFSGDPAVSSRARVLPEMGYEEAVELAYFGAKVIHPAAAKHAVARELTLVVRSSLNPDRPGTRIRSDLREAPGVEAVASKKAVTLVSVRCRPLFLAHGFLARTFGVLADHGLSVDLVATSHTSTAFTVDRSEELDAVLDGLRQFAEVEVTDGLAVVTVVGRGLLRRPGIVARVLGLLEDEPVHLISQASDVSLNLLVSQDAAPAVVERIHEALLVAEEQFT